MTGRVLYKSSVSNDLKKINPKDRVRILGQIKTSLGESPMAGEPLHGEFEGLFKLRVGDYRVIYAISGQEALVLRIRHRGKAYV